MNTASDGLELSVRQRLDSLTKPQGSLGRLEDIALRFALIRGEQMPSASRKVMYVFCADHGVTDEGVSPFPRSVTRQMVLNFVRGGAAINVLCRTFGIQPMIVNAGVEGDCVPGAIDARIAGGTANFARGAAMTRDQAQRSLDLGFRKAAEAAANFDLAGLGEMGIGNTTAAAALLSVFTRADPDETAGAGTGSDQAGISRKAAVIRRALELHRPDPSDGLGVLAAVGGFEIGAIAGFIIGAAEHNLPVVLDGFPCCSGALVARAIQPGCLRTVFFGHRSAERAHSMMLASLGADPLIELGMRLGEGSGAAIAMGIVDSAVRLYREMATFEEAAVERDA
jgi:nicotinate-nucleotide--dimethylbenzimidazole phosphoribosyltransferase